MTVILSSAAAGSKPRGNRRDYDDAKKADAERQVPPDWDNYRIHLFLLWMRRSEASFGGRENRELPRLPYEGECKRRLGIGDIVQGREQGDVRISGRFGRVLS